MKFLRILLFIRLKPLHDKHNRPDELSLIASYNSPRLRFHEYETGKIPPGILPVKRLTKKNGKGSVHERSDELQMQSSGSIRNYPGNK